MRALYGGRLVCVTRARVSFYFLKPPARVFDWLPVRAVYLLHETLRESANFMGVFQTLLNTAQFLKD